MAGAFDSGFDSGFDIGTMLEYQPPQPPWVLGSWARGVWARDSWGVHDEEDAGDTNRRAINARRRRRGAILLWVRFRR